MVIVSFAIAGLMTITTSRSNQIMIEQHKQQIDAGVFADAFGYTFLIMTFVAIAGALLALLLTKPKTVQAEDEKTAEIHLMV